MFSGKSEVVIDKEFYRIISRRIAFQIHKTKVNLIEMDDLVCRLENENHIHTALNFAWLVRQIKNDMAQNQLLFIRFEKPLHQLVGLTSKGKELLIG